MTPIHEDDWLELLGEAAALPSAPSTAVRAALELWRDHAPVGRGGRVRRWIAALTFDSWATPATEAGIRSIPGEARHLLFAAAGQDVDLRIDPMASGFVVSGQHLGPKTKGAVAWYPVDAASSSTLPPRIDVTPSGEFCIEGVDGGTYRLELTFGDEQIVLAPIIVGARSSDS